MSTEEEIKLLKYIAWKKVVPIDLSLNENRYNILKKLTDKGLVKIISHKYTDYRQYAVLTRKGRTLLMKRKSIS